jgi:hypothetical protein
LLGTNGVCLFLFVLQLSWFPFFLFDTDWMGREVYHGDPNGNLSERKAYDDGVREGAFGLLLNSVRTCDQFVYHKFRMTIARCICIPGMYASIDSAVSLVSGN